MLPRFQMTTQSWSARTKVVFFFFNKTVIWFGNLLYVIRKVLLKMLTAYCFVAWNCLFRWSKPTAVLSISRRRWISTGSCWCFYSYSTRHTALSLRPLWIATVKCWRENHANSIVYLVNQWVPLILAAMNDLTPSFV